MIINSKCGKYSVNIIDNGGRGETFIAVARMNVFDSETMNDTSYWFLIGHYKTLKSAIRQSAKKMTSRNIELAVA
ncbi:hypothetical protein FACS1894217_13660 [Clostridia bacterium]|nr:hypothetical protein FACS1894217_13660 [Clostridia bacterium]GHV36777.1 hypothetical protein FACS18949_16540 [Clostridia bacterium]